MPENSSCLKCAYSDTCLCKEVKEKQHKEGWQTMSDAYNSGLKAGANLLLEDFEKRISELHQNVAFMKKMFN